MAEKNEKPDTDDESYPKDETLRLVMAADQEQWLRQKIRESRIVVRAMAIVLVLSTVWAATDFSTAFAQYDKVDCYILSPDAPDFQELRDQFIAEGLKPCPPGEAAGKGIDWTDIRVVVATLSVLLMLASTLTLLRHLFLLRRYTGYLTDHRAFLEKYNRL